MKKIIMISAIVILPLSTYCLGVLVGKNQMSLYCNALMGMYNTQDINIANGKYHLIDSLQKTLIKDKNEALRRSIIKYGKDSDDWLLSLPSIVDYTDESKKMFRESVNFYLSEASPSVIETLSNPKKRIEEIRKDLQLEGDFNEQAFGVWEKEYLEQIKNFNRAVELTKAE